MGCSIFARRSEGDETDEGQTCPSSGTARGRIVVASDLTVPSARVRAPAQSAAFRSNIPVEPDSCHRRCSSTNTAERHTLTAVRSVSRVTTYLSATVVLATLGAAMAPHAAATTPEGVSAVVLSKNTTGGKDYIVSDIIIAPGGSTGWHTHRGEIFGIVKAGRLTHYAADCHQDGEFGVGVPITDPTGDDNVHLGRNLGTGPVVLGVTYVDTAGAPTSDSVPNPGCDFE